jgi:uncharacterized protein (TIGR00255 family)
MTAFARYTEQTAQGRLTWELRSVNQRYLDIQFRIPAQIRVMETDLRATLQQRLSRGNIECTLAWQGVDANAKKLVVDEALVKQLHDACQLIARQMDQTTPPALTDIMAWPGVLQHEIVDQRALAQVVATSLHKAVDQLLVSRSQEGQRLAGLVEQRLAQIDQHLQVLKQQQGDQLAQQQARLLERLGRLGVECAQERLAQEAALLVQKSDYTEELDRLISHVQATRDALQQPVPVGRRLDFLMQEFNREANTLASKAVNQQTTALAIEIKVLVEQMREQVQNIE